MSSDALRVFIVDDSEAYRSALRDLLADAPGLKIVGEHTGEPGVAAAVRASRANVALVDVRVRGREAGPMVVVELRATCPSLRIIALSISLTQETARAMGRAGADACISKDAELAELVEAIRGQGTPCPA